MNYFKYLKNGFPVYIISGVLLGLAIFSLVTIHRYNNFLRDSLETIHTIYLKEAAVKKEINQIDSLAWYFQDSFGIKEEGFNSEKLILHALDEMKTHLNNASVTVSRFENAAGEKRFPVDIRIPVASYEAVIDYAGYIESFRLPDFKIKDISLNKEQTGEVVLSIKGSFVVPLTGGS
jgi:hypothetical protein